MHSPDNLVPVSAVIGVFFMASQVALAIGGDMAGAVLVGGALGAAAGLVARASQGRAMRKSKPQQNAAAFHRRGRFSKAAQALPA